MIYANGKPIVCRNSTHPSAQEHPLTKRKCSPLAYFMHSPSLFDEAPSEGHRLAFERWLDAQRATGSLRQPASVQVYRDMWGAFTAWCLGQSPAITLASLDLRDLQAFQAARFGRKSSDLSLSPRHALRLIRLIDRVLRHHAAQVDEHPNTAASDWLAAHPKVRYAEAGRMSF